MQIITPRLTKTERLLKWCRSWSPQVKQSVVGGTILAVLTVGGWFVVSKSGPAPKAPSVMTATNVSGSVMIQGDGNRVDFGTPPRAVPAPGIPVMSIETMPGLPMGTTNDAGLRL